MDRIKESFDSLPVAACFFDASGVVRLINHRMLTIGNQLRRGGIQTLTELQSALQSPPDAIRCLNPELQIFRFPDGTALRFAQEPITTRAGISYTQVTAGDVTERIHRQNQLKEENEKLTQANERLRLLFRQMPDIIRQEEILAMKLRVHDNIGHSILAARRTLLRQPSLEEIRACAALWEQSITVLYRSNQMTVPPEPMEAAIRRAGEMGVRVLAEGTQLLPWARGNGGYFVQQWDTAPGRNHRGGRPVHAAASGGGSRGPDGNPEQPQLPAADHPARKGGIGPCMW